MSSPAFAVLRSIVSAGNIVSEFSAVVSSNPFFLHLSAMSEASLPAYAAIANPRNLTSENSIAARRSVK